MQRGPYLSRPIGMNRLPVPQQLTNERCSKKEVYIFNESAVQNQPEITFFIILQEFDVYQLKCNFSSVCSKLSSLHGLQIQ